MAINYPVSQLMHASGPCTKEQLQTLTHQLANNRSVINWSAYVLYTGQPAQPERQQNEEMLQRNCADIQLLFTHLQICFQELDPVADHNLLFGDLTSAVNLLQATQTTQHLAEFERLVKRLRKLTVRYMQP